MRVERRSIASAFGLLLAALFLIAGAAHGHCAGRWIPGPEADAQTTTLVIFADRKMADGEWAALFEALRRNMADEVPLLGSDPRVIRGDQMKPGLEVEQAVVVYVHGDCNLQPLARRTAYGVPLGWVRRVDGRIEPFAHVDCTRIGQVLGARAAGLSRERRDAMMAGAMAQVILHEWIHIATQSPGHGSSGVTKAEFGVEDLVAGEGEARGQR